jgi:antitoxin Phd
MKIDQWSVQDAKNKFSAVVDAAERGKAQLVTRRGIPTVVVISVAEFEKLKQLEAQQLPTIVDHLLRAWKEITVTDCAGFSFAFKARKDAHSDSM